ncbi:carbamoyl-phosphate synthase large subunit [Actinosynnema sp. CS-041913]|uniref:carbamoyl-phosphate synthase large subunit n=1 Tax=Actinosynnema sp. CS-041913 TaxID=3239917 RepID=UPI003D93EBD5
MTRRADLGHVLVIGSGPIRIGQAAEFDYSGTQACRVLRAEGLRVSLVNSNPATIMTDPEFADATYVEPLTAQSVEDVIAAERPDALLATLGGQTALNVAVELHERGVLAKYDVELIGADIEAIRRGEDRQRFKEIVRSVGGEVPRSRRCRSLRAVHAFVADHGLPVVVRPSFTMGGLGSGVARAAEDVERIAAAALAESPVHEVLVEESVLGWKEYELELMRDRHDNVVVVCAIENVDPMGVHTGDSVTVAPTMTLTDREYQRMRDLGIAVLRAVGVDTGGCNIQFAVDPRNGDLVVIEMNPRVSRSSALASKATGFPIAKIATQLAIGYTLDEITNDITGETPASFEPTLDYVVVKVPRFDFAKFPDADRELTTTMKSVGEAMAVGRSFPEALGKAMRSTETTRAGFWTGPDEPGPDGRPRSAAELLRKLRTPHEDRLYTMEEALRRGATVAEVARASGVDPWFVDQIALISEVGAEIAAAPELDADLVRHAKCTGLSDAQLAALRPELADEHEVRRLRHRWGVRPVFKTVDTCAGEFAARTPYHYSAYEHDSAAETEIGRRDGPPKVVILGAGPNRIGQGVEFDYSCVHAVIAARQRGFEAVLVNCNPETVSTDYDISDRLYFEPVTLEDVLEIVAAEDDSSAAEDPGAGGVAGVVVQLGGQTPLRLAGPLVAAGVPVLGTPPEAIDTAEDRGVFADLLARKGLTAPRWGMATSVADIRRVADEIGYPVLVRPSYVLGGQGMHILDDEGSVDACPTGISADRPALVDQFLDGAVEIDVDALYDGVELYVGAVMEHIEPTGVHSGDSSCVLPPVTLRPADLAAVRSATEAIAEGVGVRGLLNVQYALHDGTLSVLEANPRASRTVPFVSKATGVALAKAATLIMTGSTIAELRASGVLSADDGGASGPPTAVKAVDDGASWPPAAATALDAGASGRLTAVKAAVLPFHRFRTPDGDGVDCLLGPEMKSTGEVMGVDTAFPLAFAKAQLGVHGKLPDAGAVFVTAPDGAHLADTVRELTGLGLAAWADPDTATALRLHGVRCAVVTDDDALVAAVRSGELVMVVTVANRSRRVRGDRSRLRAAAVAQGIPCVTTAAGAWAMAVAIGALQRENLVPYSLQGGGR